MKQSHTSGLSFSETRCRVSGWLVSDISRECVGLILKVDFPRRMDIAPSNIRPLLLTNHPVTRRHILVERRHSYFVISARISPRFSHICLCTQKHSFSNQDMTNMTCPKLKVFKQIMKLSSSIFRISVEMQSFFDLIHFSLRGIYTDCISGLWWSSFQSMRHSGHLGFLQALLWVHSQTHNMKIFVVLTAVLMECPVVWGAERGILCLNFYF